MPASASKPLRPKLTSGLSSKVQALMRPATSQPFLRAKKRFRYRHVSPDKFVIGADQTLALGDKFFSKPADRAPAAEQLRALAGRSHELYSAVAVARDGKILFEAVGRRAHDDAAARGCEIEATWTRQERR